MCEHSEYVWPGNVSVHHCEYTSRHLLSQSIGRSFRLLGYSKPFLRGADITAIVFVTLVGPFAISRFVMYSKESSMDSCFRPPCPRAQMVTSGIGVIGAKINDT
jgi:hypothetical protein